MSTTSACPECGVRVPDDAPQGLCPRCLMDAASASLTGSFRPAVGKAREFVRAALLAAPGFGAGHGPMGHHAVR